MGIDGFWWFYKVEEPSFSAVQLEFNEAVKGAPSLPAVPSLAPRPKAPPVTQGYVNSIMEGMFVGSDLCSEIYHEPFNVLAYKLLEEEAPLPPENCIKMVMQSRVLPPAILLMGIGSERFSQLPGHLGNMLLHPDEIEEAIVTVAQALEVDWDGYFQRAKLILDYAGSDDHAAKDVSDALYTIPKALAEVKAEGAGILAVMSWGCP